MLNKISKAYDNFFTKGGDLFRFAFHSLIVMAIIGAVLIYSLYNTHKNHIIGQLAESTMLSGKTTITPALEDYDLNVPMKGEQLDKFDYTVRKHLLAGETVRIKIWNREGMIVYSDEHRLIGRKFKIESDLRNAFSGKLHAAIMKLEKKENIYEKKHNELIEIYVPLYLKGQQIPGAAYEVYIKPAAVNKHLLEDKRTITSNIFFGLLFLYLSLFWFYREAHKRAKKSADELGKLNYKLNKSLSNLKDTYMDTMRALTLAVDAKDHYTAGHSIRVADISIAIAKAMGLSKDALETIERAALFHDIGKIGLPGDILNKVDSLSPEEMEEIKKHPVVGSKIVSAVKFLNETVSVVKHHHEHYDGRGYPAGLKSKEISREARIIAVADAYDAITTGRPHCPARSSAEAIEEITKCSGTQFDPAVVKALIQAIKQGDIQKTDGLNYAFTTMLR